MSRRGCAGDRIEIQGSNLGSLGELTIGFAEIITEEWDNDHILFVLPDSVIGNSIDLCVNPMIPECSGFSLVCKLAEIGTDYSFEVVQSPEIEFFNPAGPTLRPIEDERFELEACTGVQLQFLARQVENAIIRTSDGTIIWDSGPGIPRTIDSTSLASPLNFGDLRNDTTFTFEASNLCGTITSDISIMVYHAIHLESGARVRTGGSLNINIRISCPAPAGGVEINFATSLPGVFDFPPDSIIIPEGETRAMHTIDALSNCAETTLTGTATGHRDDMIPILVFDTPVITQVNPLIANACSSLNLTIQGDCFDPLVAGNQIIAKKGGDRRIFTNSAIRFMDMDNRGHNAEIDASINNLNPGNWDICIQSNSLESVAFASPLIIQAVPPLIHNFSSDITQIFPCVNNRVTISWEVSRISRIEILNGGRSIHSSPTLDSCSRQTGSTTITLTERTDLRLRGFPIGTGEAVESTLTISEIVVPQASRIRIENRTRGSLFPEHTLTIWNWNRTTGAKTNEETISHGDNIEIDLNDCNLHVIYAVSHQWINEHNRRHSTSFSPTDPDITLYPQFHKLTVPNTAVHLGVLGRDGTSTLTFTIEPGG